MDKVVYFNNLFTIYKELLTLKEQEIFSLYYEENLSMGEIALNKDISRSAVGSTVKIVEKKLEKYESILHVLCKEQHLQDIISRCRDEKLKKEFDELVMYNHKEDNIKVLNFTNQVPQLMSVSDLVITKPGGLTTTESLASGLPIIIIDPIPGQEEENANFLEKNGVAIWLKKEDNIEKVLSDLFSSPNKIKEMKIKARLLAKKNSTKDICKILLS